MTTSIKFSELKNLPPISPARMAEIEAFEDTDFSDCPEITDEEWRTAQPLYPPTAIVGELVRERIAATA
ncbi:MAG: hypothetical protein LBR23_08815 [Spirochaetaceae bacterium]|jgi:hypothetical protein|nr:hypothetical protein [Spirochaetaceae bacterium]